MLFCKPYALLSELSGFERGERGDHLGHLAAELAEVEQPVAAGEFPEDSAVGACFARSVDRPVDLLRETGVVDECAVALGE